MPQQVVAFGSLSDDPYRVTGVATAHICTQFDGESARTNSSYTTARRIALVETKTVDTAAPPLTITPVIRYQPDNHLGSACLERDGTDQIISYEEYYPYGSTAYQAGRSVAETSLKRYRYTGKERDEESGLYCYGARYYASWLGRWTATDLAVPVDGPNLYCYAHANPVVYHDPDGRQSVGPDSVISLARWQQLGRWPVMWPPTVPADFPTVVQRMCAWLAPNIPARVRSPRRVRRAHHDCMSRWTSSSSARRCSRSNRISP